jgi:hypothetical protein
LDAAQASEAGHLLRRAIDLHTALKMGFRIGLDEVRSDEFTVLLLLAEEQAKRDCEITNSPAELGRSALLG